MFICTLKHTNRYSFEQQQFKSWKGNTKTNRTQKAGEQSASACGNKTHLKVITEKLKEKKRKATQCSSYLSFFFYKINGIVNEQNQKWYKEEEMFRMVFLKISLLFLIYKLHVRHKEANRHTPYWKNKPCSNVTIVSKGGIVLESSLSVWSRWRS